MKSGESLAVWTIKGTSIPDNGTRVVCQQSNNPEKRSAVLHVYGKDFNHLKTWYSGINKSKLFVHLNVRKAVVFFLSLTGFGIFIKNKNKFEKNK